MRSYNLEKIEKVEFESFVSRKLVGTTNSQIISAVEFKRQLEAKHY